MRARYIVLTAVAIVLLSIAGSAIWLLTTESGARFAARQAVAFLHGKLALGDVAGTLSGPLTLTNIRYKDPDSGVDAAIERVDVDVHLRELLNRRVHVRLAAVRGARVDLSEPLKPTEPEPFSLAPPIDLAIDAFRLERATVRKEGATLAEIRSAKVAGRWTNRGIDIQTLDVEAEQGTVSIAGQVADATKDAGYVGEAHGSFDWRAGDQTFAGTLTAKSAAKQLQTTVALASPARAQIAATLGENDTLPWTVHLDLPAFDPRQSLLKDSSIAALGAMLDAHGDRQTADVSGDVNLNGEHAIIEALRAAWADPVLTISSLTLKRPGAAGELNVAGTVAFDQDPFVADVKAQWTTIELPGSWVGQRMLTQGEVTAHGNAETFAVKGGLKLGPPGRLADLTIDINGTPQRIEIRQATVAQKGGTLSTQGTVELQPRVKWQLVANARSFDPGAFAAAWPGKLGFRLQTNGEVIDRKPSGSLKLADLVGTLRGRTIAGSADLSYESSGVLAGTLDLKSGQSSVHVTGARGQALDATARFDIASLDDWAPGTGGKLSGTAHASGRWPQIDVTTDINVQHVVFSGIAVGTATLSAMIHDPQHPSGTLKTRLTDVAAEDFHFTSIAFDADGNEAAHNGHLKVDGDPLSAEVSLHGALAGHAWTGTVAQLSLTQKDVASLALQQPMLLHFADPQWAVAESCLAGNGISLCFGAERSATREIKVDYRIEHLPLSLIIGLAEPGLPFKVSGTLEGHGDARQTANGALFGTAILSSDSGEISEAGESGQTLLQYQQFQLNAELAGETASGTVKAQLGPNGSLEGHATLAALTSATPTIDASGKLSIADLTPVSLFVSQLANVHGAGDATFGATGPLRAPQLSGQAHVANFAAEIPKIGVKLHDGDFTGALGDKAALKLDGHIASGTGVLTVAGQSGADGGVKIKLSGKDFLAADIPGARVVIAPDLDFSRTRDRMDLSGRVAIPDASVDLTKLPQGKQQRSASADVVVIDDKSAAQARGTPLYANVTISLGDKVKLAGFGLDATLTGQLDVQDIPGQDTTGAGEIRVAGKYKAYGQDLTIQEGRLLYANQTLTNPQVIITAVRAITTGAPVTAKLTVTGTAQRPQLDVSADPAMSQTQALSYLVTGKPVDQLSGGDGNAVQSAARTVGGAAGNLLAKNIGKRLGIDTIGVDQSDEIGGSAFTIGQYLSPRLYVSYGVGLFEPGQVITLKYKLSERVSVEAAQGPLAQRAGINYRIER